MHHKYISGKWVNSHHFFVPEKNLKQFDLTAEILFF